MLIELTEVTAKSTIILNKQLSRTSIFSSDLILDGEELKLQSIKLNGHIIPTDYYKVDNTTLSISGTYLESQFTDATSQVEIETQVIIRPDQNLALSGLYKSSHNLCTQCEAMGT